MKRLFYFLFLTPFLMTSCSDDDKEFFTRDVEYDINAYVMEVTYPTLQNMIHITMANDKWYVEGYNYKPKLTQIISQGTLHIICGELEYTKFDGQPVADYSTSRTSVAPEFCYVPNPQISFPSDISKIIISRKGAEDIYNVERSDNLLTITKQQSSFSKFHVHKYQTRPRNSFSVYFYFSGNGDLNDEFFQFVSATIPLTVYEYDPTIEPLWHVMRDYNNTRPIYLYENESDDKKIIRLFDEFCDEASKNKSNFRAHFEDWTGRDLYYPIY